MHFQRLLDAWLMVLYACLPYEPTASCSLVYVVQVLDARDPNGTRCFFLEQHIRKHLRHKHLILLLNKCDLVSCEAIRRDLKSA